MSNRDGNFEIYLMDADGGRPTRLTTDPAGDQAPRWSPDGTKLAFMSTRDGNSEIYVMNADGSGQTRVTSHPAADWSPDWSPDGTKLAFTSQRDGNVDVYVINSDGTGETRLTSDPAADFGPTWSPDGTRLAFTSTRDGSAEVYVMDRGGGSQTRLTTTPGNDQWSAWSPDGSKLAFASDRDGNLEIYVMNADGTNPTRLTHDPAFDGEPAWSSNGWNLAFSSDRDGNYEVYVMSADGSNLTRLTNNTALDVQPDWQPLAVDRTPPVLTLPGNLTVDATGPAGAIVTYSVEATDDRDEHPTLVCTPLSGSTFPIGDATVTCTATDASDNSATATFTVHVRNATEQLLELRTLIESYQLEHGFGSDLSRYLNRAIKYIAMGQTEHARQQLDQFVATVERAAAKTPPRLSPEQATALTDAGHRIRAVLGG